MAQARLDRRQGHPYWMYDTLRTQPGVTAMVLDRGPHQVPGALAVLQRCARLWLIGIGSSLHAAEAGATWLRELAGVDARALPSLEAALYPPAWGPGDGAIVISHRGGGGFTVDALHGARRAGLPVVTVTGTDSRLPRTEATLETSPLEPCQCHTAGYACALLVLAQLATAAAGERGFPLPPGWEEGLRVLPETLASQLDTEGAMQAWAGALPAAGTIVFVGAGIHQATASEIGLKVQEAVHRPVMALTVEQLAHGPMACLTEGDLVISTIPAGARAERRLIEVAAGLRELGIPVWGLYPPAEAQAERSLGDRSEVEWLAPLTGLLPLQLLTYHWALLAGTDPDWNRLDEAAYAAAKTHY